MGLAGRSCRCSSSSGTSMSSRRSRVTFTDRQVAGTVESLVEGRLGRVRRAMVVKARTALVQSALAHVPPRRDPDAPVVPDHL